MQVARTTASDATCHFFYHQLANWDVYLQDFLFDTQVFFCSQTEEG